MRTTVVHIHQKFYPYQGGSTQRLLNQLSHIDKNKYEIYVVSQKIGNEPKEETYKGIKIIRYKYFFEIPIILYKLSKKTDIHLIHAHNYRPSFYSCLFNMIIKKPLIIEMHSIYKVKNKLSQWIGNNLLKKADSIVVLSNQSFKILREDLKINNEIKIIYNGIEIDDFKSADKTLINFDENMFNYIKKANEENHILVGYIGSVRAFQGIDNLISIINTVANQNIKFLVVGGSIEENQELKSKINNPNVYIREFVNKEQAKYVYKNLDILLMPRPHLDSTDSALPLKPIEAIAAGNIIYSTAVGGMVELKDITQSEKIVFMTVDEMISNLNSMKNINSNQKLCDEDKLELFNIKTQVTLLQNVYTSLVKGI